MDNLREENELQNIINIYSLNENNKQFWDFFSYDINNDNLNEKIIIFIKNKLLEEKNIELTEDIIDYIIDKGSSSIIDRIFQKDFFDLFINKTIENNNQNIKIEEKSLFLLKKWINKFYDKYNILIEKYNYYKNNGKSFPESINTYNKYINTTEYNNENIKQSNDIDNLNEKNDILSNINNNEKENIIENENNIDDSNFDIDNFLKDNNVNLSESIHFPEDDDTFQNQFSNLRASSEIPMYFKNLRSKSLIKSIQSSQINNQNKNDNENSNNIEIDTIDKDINNTNKEKNDKDNNITIDDINEKKPNNTEQKINTCTDNNSIFQNYIKNPLIFQNKWNEEIISLNKWIKEGKNSQNFENLKEGIKQMVIEIDEIDEIIVNCAKIGEEDVRYKVSYIKSDMEQTCYRYECLIQGKKVEKFKSAFDGNVKQYNFDKQFLLDENNINIIEDNKKENKMYKIGRAIKDGFIKVGKKIGIGNNNDKK